MVRDETHITIGIEIYGGKPILYSLGNLIFQNDTVDVFPAEAYERFGLGDEATPVISSICVPIVATRVFRL